ncbi:MAG: sulfatase-like hydrolase/transferase, partial [Bacteroidales bacterium]
GPDIFCDFILDFIGRKEDRPFFIYYPMVLVHDPFVPTPDSEEWSDKDLRSKGNPRYFVDMMGYADKIVGRILDKLDEEKIRKNTIVVFTADNGTSRRVVTKTKDGDIPGGKGLTMDTGIHVPLIISWPAKMRRGKVYDGLIGFCDFFPTLAEISRTEVPENDGQSFYPLIVGKPYERKEWILIHYDPIWSEFLNRQRNRFVKSEDYKLYLDGRFYYLPDDPFEENALPDDLFSEEGKEIRKNLQQILDKAPEWR